MGDSDRKKGKGREQDEQDDGILASVASSASSLLSSIASPSASSMTSDLDSSSSSKSGRTQSAAGKPSSWSETTPRSQHLVGQPCGFRTQSSDSMATAEEDFASFSTNLPDVFTATSREDSDGFAVANLLSSSLTSEIYSDDVSRTIQSLDRLHPAVIRFAECDDPVEFLQKKPEWGQYSESVWGNLLDLLKDASQEVDQGKKDEGESVDRVKRVWVELKSKL